MADLTTAVATFLAAAQDTQAKITAMRASLTALRNAEDACWALQGKDGNKPFNGTGLMKNTATLAGLIASWPSDYPLQTGPNHPADFIGDITARWTPYLT